METIKAKPLKEWTSLEIAVYAVNCPNDDERADEVAKLIEAYAASGWISVKERLPDPGIKVMVCLKYGAGNTEITMSYTTKRFPDCFDHLLNERITHWMPLPAPPTLL